MVGGGFKYGQTSTLLGMTNAGLRACAIEHGCRFRLEDFMTPFHPVSRLPAQPLVSYSHSHSRSRLSLTLVYFVSILFRVSATDRTCIRGLVLKASAPDVCSPVLISN